MTMAMPAGSSKWPIKVHFLYKALFCFPSWERLSVGIVPAGKMHPIGTLPKDKRHPI